MRLPATPRPSSGVINPDDPKTWGPPETWPSWVTCEPIPRVNGANRGAAKLVVAACEPGAYVRRFSCGVINGDNKAFPIYKAWGNIPADGSHPVFFTHDWPAEDNLWPGTFCLFVEYAAPSTPWSPGGLGLAVDYAS